MTATVFIILGVQYKSADKICLQTSLLCNQANHFLISFINNFPHRILMKMRQGIFTAFAAALFGIKSLAADAPIILDVDASEAPRNILHARLHIPAAAGTLTLFYPKWIPGEHGPTGPVNDVTGLKFSANDQPLDWRRDAEDMFAIHVTVPTGADAVDAAFDFLPNAGGGAFSAGGSATAHLVVLSWNQLLMYPTNAASLKIPFAASLKLPDGWKFGTALPIAKNDDSKIQFLPAPLETLIDSPVLAGEFLETVALTPQEKVQHFIHVAADNEADLKKFSPTDEYFTNVAHLVHEENAVFGAHHYRDYHFLLTCSEHVEHFGLEHHESSDDRVGADFLTDEDARTFDADLLAHEMFHSWNGKFRRPAGLATPDYQQPMRGELLWVYEGLTDYYGKVLATRAGLNTNDDFRAEIALNAAALDHRSGRRWRPLADTTVAAQLLYESPDAGVNRRRSVDFYSEGDLIWLEADTIIRQLTKNKKSLDDFCKKFHGGETTDPKVVPYDFDEVVNTLNSVAPNDWKKFFDERIYQITPHAPLGGIENGGWKLIYTNAVPPFLKIREDQKKYTDVNYSLGFSVSPEGGIGDLIPDSPADKAGIVQGMKLVAVNGHGWSAKNLRAAVSDATTNSAAIQLLTERDDFYRTFSVDYHGGERYPILVRDEKKSDYLDDILKPLVKK
jgi:predicted metalloprotease with PDZ domain